MAEVILREATRADEAALEKLMREIPMGENIRVTFRREGGYFKGAAVQCEKPAVHGLFTDVGRALGLYAAGKRRVWVDGEIRQMRYLSDLRLHPELRGMRWLFRGYRRLSEEMGGECAQSLILSDNREVLKLLTNGRAGLPKYHAAGEYVSYFFGPKKNWRARTECEFRKARRADLVAMQELYDEHARQFQFAPVLDFSTLENSSYFAGLRLEDVYLAFEGGELQAMLGVWDQSAYKQLMVESYSRCFRFLRPFSRLLRGMPLPKAGERIGAKTITMPVCRAGRLDELRDLLQWARSEQERGTVLMLGLDAEDARKAVMAKIPGVSERGRHFLVGEVPEALVDSGRPFVFDLARV